MHCRMIAECLRLRKGHVGGGGYDACKSTCTSMHFKFAKLIIQFINREANVREKGGNDKTSNISADILLVVTLTYNANAKIEVWRNTTMPRSRSFRCLFGFLSYKLQEKPKTASRARGGGGGGSLRIRT